MHNAIVFLTNQKSVLSSFTLHYHPTTRLRYAGASLAGALLALKSDISVAVCGGLSMDYRHLVVLS